MTPIKRLAKRRGSFYRKEIVIPGFAFGLFLLILSTPMLGQYTPADWPGSGANASLPWVPLRAGNGSLIQDVNTEAIAVEFNITYNSAPDDASVYLAYDQITATCFFRLQLMDSPWDPSKNILDNGFWIVQLGDSTSTAVSDPRGAIVVNGNGQDIRVVNGWAQSAVPTTIYSKIGTPAVWTETYRISPVTGTTTTYYLDFQIPIAALTSYVGITASSDLRFYFGTSQANGTTGSINKDWMLGSASTVDFTSVAVGEMTSISGGALPVELTGLSARYNAGATELTWQTATELNNYGFEVQRSREGEHWDVVGFVSGAGTVFTPQWYRFSDLTGNSTGRLLYRLRQIDRDGSSEFSSIVEVLAAAVSIATCSSYPNPANGQTMLTYTLSEAGAMRIALLDVLGREVRVIGDNSLMDAGSYSALFDTYGLRSGSYFIHLSHARGQTVYPLIVSD